MLLSKGITQEDIDAAAKMKILLEETVALTSSEINFEMLILWWLMHEQAEA